MDISNDKILKYPTLWDKKFIIENKELIIQKYIYNPDMRDKILENANKINDMWGLKIPTYTTFKRHNKRLNDIHKLSNIAEELDCYDIEQLLNIIKITVLKPFDVNTTYQEYIIHSLSNEFINKCLIDSKMLLNKIHYYILMNNIINNKFDFTSLVMFRLFRFEYYNNISKQFKKEVLYEVELQINELIEELKPQFKEVNNEKF